jgi:hypothetical protein
MLAKYRPTCRHALSNKGDEKMRASKLITISAFAALMGGSSLAIGQVGGGTMQGSGSEQSDGSMPVGAAGQGTGASSSETRGSDPRAAENPLRRSEISGERGSKAWGSRHLEHGHAMATARRAITGERGQTVAIGARGQALATEHGRAMTGQGLRTAHHTQGEFRSPAHQTAGQRQTTGLAYARATTSDVGLNAQQRMRLREILSARRDIPRVSNLETDVRVNAFAPKGVRLAAVPEEVVRIYPRFRRDRVFIHRDKFVIVDPATSRIIAVLAT